jgi:hypothetical protein
MKIGLDAIAPLSFIPDTWGEVVQQYTPPPPVDTSKSASTGLLGTVAANTGTIAVVAGVGALVWWLSKNGKKRTK